MYGGGSARHGVWPELTRHPLRHRCPDALARICCMDCRLPTLIYTERERVRCMHIVGKPQRMTKMMNNPYQARIITAIAMASLGDLIGAKEAQ